jgi:predicted phosphodiesterase
MMRIAVFSDLHGNPFACKAVLEAIEKVGPFDAVVAAGDLCLGGSDPAACVDMLRQAGVIGVYGNTETYILHPERTPNDDLHRNSWDSIQPVAYWVRAQLSDDQLAWLGALPFEQRFSPTGVPADDLLVVHANPKDIELMIYPAPEGQLALWGQVRQPDDHPDLVAVLEDVDVSTVVFGHFHTTFQRRWRGLNLVDVACCSMSSIDKDKRARYTVLTWNGDGWEVDPRWVEYDYRLEAVALQSSDIPDKKTFLRYLE